MSTQNEKMNTSVHNDPLSRWQQFVKDPQFHEPSVISTESCPLITKGEEFPTRVYSIFHELIEKNKLLWTAM